MSKSNRRKLRAPSRQRYVESLDGLRALCALAVVGYHMRLPWLAGGYMGVTVLFVLAGYLVTAGLVREFGMSRGSIDLVSFWKRRFWRLMPTVVVFIVVTGAVCSFLNEVLFTKMRPDILPALFMIINWTKIFTQVSYFDAAGAASPLTHFWTLAIEAQFYLVWPPILYLLMRKRVSRLNVRRGILAAAALSCALMAILYVPGADPSRVYYGTDTRAFNILLGCWLAIVWPFDLMSARKASKLKGLRQIVVKYAGPVCLVALCIMMVFENDRMSFSYYGGFLLCSLLTVGAIAALVPEGSVMSRVMSFAPLKWIGKRGYAIYIWHYPILELMNPLNATTEIPWWKYLLELAIILVVSELSYRLVEVPLRALGKPQAQAGPAHAANKRAHMPGMGRRMLQYVPALLITLVAGGLTIWGLMRVAPVTVAGDKPGEKRVMQASLKKPLLDGVYDVVLIGDSVSLGANKNLNEAFPHGLMDTQGYRMPEEGLEVLKGYLADGVVGDDVVISLGTNGVLDEDLMDTFLEEVGPDRRIWFVNMRSPNAKDEDNNALIDEYVADNDNVYLIDWNGFTAGHDEYLIEDGIHLTYEGREAYTQLIVDTMGYEVPDESNTTYDVTLIGDSVCLDAADQLHKQFPRGIVDSADGRTVEAMTQALEDYVSQDVVGHTVVVCLASEGKLSSNDLDAMINVVGDKRDLWLVNARTLGDWQDSNNKLIEQAAEDHDNVYVVDWYKASSEGSDGYRKDWFKDDGTHLTDAGAKAYADLIAKVVEVRTGDSDNATEDGTGNAADDESITVYDQNDGSKDEGTTSTSADGEDEGGTAGSTTSNTTDDEDDSSNSDTTTKADEETATGDEEEN